MTTADDPQGGDPPGGEPFLRRWSRRKRDVGDDAPPPAADTSEPGASVSEATPGDDPEGGGDPAVLTDDDMPPVESLTEDTDVSGFFSEGVSEALRRQALRRLFRMPKFQLRDGLDDYDGDYRAFTPLGDTVTSDMRLQSERRLAAEQDQAATGEESRTDATAEGQQAGTPEGAVEGELAGDTGAYSRDTGTAPQDSPVDGEDHGDRPSGA
ncbi:DUF3306 domain-containing protein [Arhodomonas sp. SL1]|uniref:DUF3306 domain-containing protein n=1 Tax=Arhodomonas sp. SL1 TaxID=3425691 RepID=UPI003F880B56